jgi:hypothetical protein
LHLFIGGSNANPTSSYYDRSPGSANLGSPTGLYDPARPDGPDFSSGYSSPESPTHYVGVGSVGVGVGGHKADGAPLKIGVDLYPIRDGSASVHSGPKLTIGSSDHDKQQVLLHLNLMPDKQTDKRIGSYDGAYHYNG